MTRYLFILICLTCFTLQAQDLSIGDYEKESYDSFTKGDWKGTITSVELAFSDGLDYPSLHYRKGIAHYYLGQYDLAIDHLRKYQESNKRDPEIQIYIYYCYWFQNLYIEALESVKKSHKFTKYKTQYLKPKLLENLTIESAQKFSSKPDSIGQLLYLNFNSSHQLSHRLRLKTQVSNLKQPMYWGSFVQNQYLLGTDYYLGNKWTLKASGQFFTMDANLKMNLNDSVMVNNFKVLTIDSLQGGKLGNGTNLFLGINRYFDQFNCTLFGSFFNYKIDNNQSVYSRNIPLNDTLKTDSTWITNRSSFQIGSDIQFYPSKLNKKLLVGVQSFLHMNDSASAFKYKPYFNFEFSKKWFLYADYMKIGIMDFSENEGLLLQNGEDLTNSRINIKITRKLSENILGSILYQRENKFENYLNQPYNYNSIVIGLNMQL